MLNRGAEIDAKPGKKPVKAPKVKVTIENMKDFLGKLKRHNLYAQEVNQKLKEDYLRIIEEILMPFGASSFTNAFKTPINKN
jgi:hypothetical protein